MHLPLLLSFILTLSSASSMSVLRSSPSEIGGAKLAVAHFMVGNSYPYTIDDWQNDITLAASKGLDGFALNVGRDSWQPDRVASAYAAAKNCSANGIDFKLFVSFDMTSLPCSGSDDANTLRNYITTYSSHPNQLRVDNMTMVSTFAGENCRFGTGSLNAGWTSAIKEGLPLIHFIPSFFVDPTTFPDLPVMDGAFGWNSGWPMGNYDISFDADKPYISNLDGRSYMAAVSPWFFTHYGPDTYNKNFIYRADDWLFAERWETLIQNRAVVDIAEVITWNDYGESHYVGPIEGAQPNSQSWTNGFDHQGWLDLMQYYIAGFKTGEYPPISKDRIFLWARLYPAQANADDKVGRPDRWQFTEDYLWAMALLTSPAQVSLSCGSSMQIASLPAGVSKLKLPLVTTCSVGASVMRGELRVLDFAPPGFIFSTDPPSYNFNAFVAASP